MKKALLIGSGILILVFWWHALLELLLHAVLIVLEILELLVDTVLEHVGLTLYEAQMVTAWLGFGVFTLLMIVGLKKANTAVQRLKTQTPLWWEEEKARLEAMRSSLRWPAALVVLAALLVLALIV